MELSMKSDRPKVSLVFQGPVALITLNSPETANAMDLHVGRDLIAVLTRIKEDDSLRTVVLTGAGRSFSAGANVKAIKSEITEKGCLPSDVFKNFTDLFIQATHLLSKLKQPVITAVNGPAAGGGLALALAGDLVVASSNALFDPAFLRLGLAPMGGLSMMLPLTMGLRRAAEFLYMAKPVSAEQALTLGLVNRVTEPDECLETAMKMATEIAAHPGSGVIQAKQLLRGAWADMLKAQMYLEQDALVECSGEPEHQAIFEALLARLG